MQLPEDRPYTIFAEVMNQRGFAGGTRALAAGMVGGLPPHRRRPTPTMMGMGRDHGAVPGMDHCKMSPDGPGPRLLPPRRTNKRATNRRRARFQVGRTGRRAHPAVTRRNVERPHASRRAGRRRPRHRLRRALGDAAVRDRILAAETQP